MLSGAPAVAAVIPTLGRDLPRLTACISAVQASDFDGALDTVLVWNDPRVPVPELPGTCVLSPGMNLGFPGALNHARSRVAADYLWIVQDDVRPHPTCLRALLDRLTAADRPGVAAPVGITADGLVPARSRGGFLRDDGTMEEWFPPADTRPEDLDLSRPLSFVASSGSLIPLAVWDEVGGFDPDFYPLLWSDVDFCHRVRSTGHAVVLTPAAAIDHDQGGSTPGLLGEFLGEANQRRFRTKHAADGSTTAEPLDVDDELARRIGRNAGLTLIDFAEHASRRHRAERERADGLQQALWDEVAVRDRRISDLEHLLATEIPDRDRQIAALRRKARARGRRVAELRRALKAVEMQRRNPLKRLLRGIRRRLLRLSGPIRRHRVPIRAASTGELPNDQSGGRGVRSRG